MQASFSQTCVLLAAILSGLAQAAPSMRLQNELIRRDFSSEGISKASGSLPRGGASLLGGSDNGNGEVNGGKYLHGSPWHKRTLTLNFTEPFYGFQPKGVLRWVINYNFTATQGGRYGEIAGQYVGAGSSQPYVKDEHFTLTNVTWNAPFNPASVTGKIEANYQVTTDDGWIVGPFHKYWTESFFEHGSWVWSFGGDHFISLQGPAGQKLQIPHDHFTVAFG